MRKPTATSSVRREVTCSAWFPATGIVRRYSSKRSIRRMYRATCSPTDANPSIPDAFRALDHVRIAISPEAIAIHSSTIECEGRAVLFLGESGREKHPYPAVAGAHSRSTAAQRRQPDYPDVPGAGDRFRIALERQDPLLPQHFAADCRNRPVEPGPGQRNHPTVNLAGRRIAAPVLPPGIRLRQRFAG